MGTISEKLTYLNGTKQLLKDKINNLGGSIDEQTTFRQYANQLQNVYDNLPKTEYQEGTEVTLSNCLKGKLDFDEDNGKKIVGYGDTEQDGEPTPSTPVAIQCVTGNIEEVEGGKNLYNGEKTNSTKINTSGNVYSSGGSATTPFISVLPNVTYTISSVTVERIAEYNSSDTYITRTDNNPTFTTSANTTQIRFQGSLSDWNNVMLEQGSTATTYEPYHTPITYPISLGSLEFHGIGTYKDELVTDRSTGKWYKYNKIGIDRLTSTGQSWATGTTSVSGKIRYKTTSFQNLIVIPSSNNELGKLMCNYYQIQLVTSAGSYGGKQGISVDNTGAVYVNDDTYPNNRDNWKTWLDTVNCKIIYALATPTLTEITDTTLITQLEAWYNAQSINGTTIITSNGDLPMVIKVRALKGE